MKVVGVWAGGSPRYLTESYPLVTMLPTHMREESGEMGGYWTLHLPVRRDTVHPLDPVIRLSQGRRVTLVIEDPERSDRLCGQVARMGYLDGDTFTVLLRPSPLKRSSDGTA